MAIDVNKKYVVYELNSILGSEKHQSLCKVEFDGWVTNAFESEEKAIEQLIIDKKTYTEYVIHI